MNERQLRVLALTRIFPNGQNPLAMPHIRRQAVALSKQCKLEVLATLPWFPGASLLRKFRYSDEDVSKVSYREKLFGLDVTHPRALYVPKLVFPSGLAYAASVAREVRRRRLNTDVIFSTWAYPDGFAAVVLGQMLKLPVVIQVIGSDIDVLSTIPSARAQLRWALPRAAGIIAVSRELKRKCVELGGKETTTRVLPTGVDQTIFCIRDKRAMRHELGLPVNASIILFVGRLSVEKGAEDALQAFRRLRVQMRTAMCIFVGSGPLLETLQQAAQTIDSSLLVTGPLPEIEVAKYIAACDVLTLPSYHEGTPNVVLEALSCGRPVVASKTGGIPALISSQEYGQLVDPGDTTQLTNAFQATLSVAHAPERIVGNSNLRSLDENAKQVLEFCKSVLLTKATRTQQRRTTT